MRYPLFRKSLHKLPQVFLYFFDSDLERICNVVNPLLFRQVFGWVLIAHLDQPLEGLRVLERVNLSIWKLLRLISFCIVP